MKRIKVFLASSEELKFDRIAFGNLVRRLDDIYEKRGIRVKLFEWEDFDAAYNCSPKQGEYNEHIKTSDMFLALFHTKAGKFTIEEFNLASNEFKQKASPKVYVYCKNLKQGDIQSQELINFKNELFNEKRHYWCRYDNSEELELHFVMQLMLVNNQNASMDSLNIDENGKITLDGRLIAHLDQMSFAMGNANYVEMSNRLQESIAALDTVRQQSEEHPDDKELRNDLFDTLNHHNQLKEEFTELQHALFATAKTIVIFQQSQVNAKLKCAIDAFNSGELKKANSILDDIARDAEHHIKQFEQNRNLIHQDIDALTLMTKTLMADSDINIDERITRVTNTYEDAVNWANQSNYDKEKHISLLMNYAEFLYQYSGQYDKALKICDEVLKLSTEIYGKPHEIYAKCHKLSGKINSKRNHLVEAHKDYKAALETAKKIYGKRHLETAKYIFNVGASLYDQGKYYRAQRLYLKAAKIFKREYQEGVRTRILLGTTYDNIGQIQAAKKKYQKALKYCNQAISTYGTDNQESTQIRIAHCYYNKGTYLNKLGARNEALTSFNEALRIRERTLGQNHSDTILSRRAVESLQQQNYNGGI
ncbi:MAG: tetratricopeptide repeat protein [Muribaculaceae bacterium]|nr:tetratricopeptide repeat protein [Muribaculaceae bacterium]